jgi:hypothetical protein
MYENFIVVLLTKMASCSMYGWIKWLNLEDSGSSFQQNLDTFVGEYINFECYWNNCDAKLKSQDFAGYISVHQAAFVACIVRFTCNIRSYYAGECDINSSSGSECILF